jgi:MFS family permease
MSIISDNRPAAKKKGFYGWFALAGTVLVTVISGGAFITSFGVFLPVISDELGWSRASLSLVLSLGFLAFGLPGPLFGFLVNKLGPRRCIILGNGLSAITIATLFFANQLWQYYLLFTIGGMGNGLGGYIAAATVTNNWFIKKRTLAMGFFTSSAGFSGFIFPPMVTAIIEGYNFRVAWLFLAGLVMLASVILGGVVLVRNRPEDYGQAPDGNYSSFYTAVEKVPVNKPSDWHIMQVFKTITIWLIVAFAAADACAQGTVIAHQIAYIKDIGFDPMVAASTVSLQSIFTIAGSLAFGALSLKLNMRYLAGAAFFFQVLSLIILLTTKNLALIYVYAAFMGIGLGAVFTAIATFIGAYYPREHYAQVIGVVLPFFVVAQSLMALAVGAIYDATRHYTLAFIIIAVCSSVGLICALRARPPKQPIYVNLNALNR